MFGILVGVFHVYLIGCWVFCCLLCLFVQLVCLLGVLFVLFTCLGCCCVDFVRCLIALVNCLVYGVLFALQLVC